MSCRYIVTLLIRHARLRVGKPREWFNELRLGFRKRDSSQETAFVYTPLMMYVTKPISNILSWVGHSLHRPPGYSLVMSYISIYLAEVLSLTLCLTFGPPSSSRSQARHELSTSDLLLHRIPWHSGSRWHLCRYQSFLHTIRT